MNTRVLLAAASALALGIGSPAIANNNGHDESHKGYGSHGDNGKNHNDNEWKSNGKTPGGDPCGFGPGVGRGNPCNDNNGNEGANGNAHKFTSTPIGLDIGAPPGHGAYVTQIGDYNRSAVTQSNARSLVIVRQHGDDNQADVKQQGTDRDFTSVGQFGDRNQATVTQSGVGANIAWVGQAGWNNVASVTQHSTGDVNGAVLAQLGADNHMSLTQNGGDNQAVLTQTGSGNEMTATQAGGDQLVWNQIGSNRPDLNITQGSNQTLGITQTNWGTVSTK